MNKLVSQRFIACHNRLKEEGKIKSSRQFALSLNYAPQSFSEVIKGKRAITLDVITHAVERYHVNAQYLFTGKGEMFLVESLSSPIVSVVTNNEGEERIAYVPIAAQAGYGGQVYDAEFMQELPTFSLPGHMYMTGTHRCFDVQGDSMEPSLYCGDKIVCSIVEQNHWINSLRDNYVYVIVTDSSVVVKRVINNISGDGSLRLISDNAFYDHYDLEIDDIKEIWKVNTIISPFMPSPGNVRNGLYEEVDDLKATIASQSQLIQQLNKTLEIILKKSRV